MKKKSLAEQAKEIIRLAETSGVKSNYFFQTTFERYQVQLSILETLEETIKSEGAIVEKEYIKGRSNVYANPAISEYNRTSDSANKTVQVLMRIIRDFGVAEEKTEDEDVLMKIINGGA